MLLYPKTAASNAFLPSQGDKAAWALIPCKSTTKCNIKDVIRMPFIFDCDPLEGKTAGQADGSDRSWSRMAPVRLINC